jgi:hypothetical protein
VEPSRGERAAQLAGIVALFTGFMFAEPALAASSSDPIRIDDCHILDSRFYAHRSLALTFTNRRSIAADEVRFTITYAGKMAQVADKGTFSPGIGIHHGFDAFPSALYYYYGFWPKDCVVDYVHYSDGSVWTPLPSSTPHPRRSQEAFASETTISFGPVLRG